MSRLTLILAAAAMCLLVSVSGLAAFWHTELRAQRLNNQTLTQQRDQARGELANQIRAAAFFNDIAAATLAAHRTDGHETQKTQTIIKTVIKHDACAVALPPAAAVDQLRAHADRLRTRAPNADTGGTAG